MPDYTLQVARIDQFRPLPSNPRKNHRVGALVRSLQRHGLGAPLVANAATGHLIAGEGRRKALRKMKREGIDPPAGIEIDAKGHWSAPTMVGHWPEDREAELALALNGGLRGSLEGDLDEAVLARILRDADDELADALNVHTDQLSQFLDDFEAPVAPPAIALDSIETLQDVATAQTTTLKLIIPEELGQRVRKLTARGVSPIDLLLQGILAHEQPAETKPARGKTATPKAKRRAARTKNPPRPKSR